MDFVLEQSEKVEREIRAREAAIERRDNAYADEVVASAREMIGLVDRPAPIYSPPHVYAPAHGRRACVRCPYAQDHQVHAS